MSRARSRRWRGRGERGGGAVELLLIAPVLLVAALLLVVAGRQVSAQLAADPVAHAAARAASLQDSAPAARAAAEQAVRDTLAGSGLACGRHRLHLDLEGLRPGGTVTARLVCTTRMDGLGLFSSGRRTITAAARVPIDTYQEAPR
ncbi:pilus assembly protein [Streptomonospora sp. PA3]|uniref:TadE/TadG family type IV pilus assembly protein n=1 Tax=Streptomonospora sp. PA3 TaxID=2607326 RepID=UPI0012DE9EEF|nr:TadE/TadG family type IV pilus assembly protein [Streptomonospora sp. PA3]MUL41596.1 pilus assembly protein [Streptomonospora sp. PA3]